MRSHGNAPGVCGLTSANDHVLHSQQWQDVSLRLHNLIARLRMAAATQVTHANSAHTVQWTRDEPQEQAEAMPSFTVEVGLCGIGVSIVDASSLRLPREVRT